MGVLGGVGWFVLWSAGGQVGGWAGGFGCWVGGFFVCLLVGGWVLRALVGV